MRFGTLLLVIIACSGPAHAEQNDLRALKFALGKVLLHDGSSRTGNSRKGVEALRLPDGAALSRALARSTESVKTMDGDRIIWNNGKHVRHSLHELARAARDPQARVSVDGPIYRSRKGGIIGVVLDSFRYDKTIHTYRQARLKLWVGKLGNQSALFLKDRMARHPVVVPLPQTQARTHLGPRPRR